MHIACYQLNSRETMNATAPDRMSARCAPRKPERTRDVQSDGDEIYFEDLKAKIRRRPRRRMFSRRDGDDSTATTCMDSWSTLNDDSFLLSRSLLDDAIAAEEKPPEKHVCFANVREVREYAVTFGDSPSCHGPCPLELDWHHSESRLEEVHLDSEWDPLDQRRLPRLLCMEERLQRVAELQGWEHVKLRQVQLLLEKVTNCIVEGIANHEFLPAPKFDELSDDDDDCAEEEPATVLEQISSES